jgi:hypothetical protein
MADAPARSGSRAPSLRAAWLAGGVAALALYAATVAPDVLMMDSGEYQWQTWLFPQVVVPQGLANLVRVHLNYLVLAKLFGLVLPLGHWAFRINLFSCVAGSIAVGNVCALTYALTRSRLATGLTFVALALGQTFWEYAVIAEVLSLQAAMVSAEILMLYLWAKSEKAGWLAALWAVNGLGIAVHVQNGLGTPVYLVLTLLALWQGKVSLRQTALCAGFWLIGVAPYVIFCVAQLHGHASLSSGLVFATIGEYGSQMLRVTPQVLLRGLRSIGLNYPTGLALLYVPGLIQLFRSPLPGRFRWGWLAVVGVNLLFVMTYDIPDQHSFFVPVYAAAAPLIGLGAAAVLKTRLAWTAAFALGLLVVPVYAVLPAVVRQPVVARFVRMPAASQIAYRDPLEFYLTPWKTGRHNERRYVEEVLAGLPPHAVLYCCLTVYDGIKAVQFIESRRPDVTLNPPVEYLIGLVGRGEGGVTHWRRPLYAWAQAGKGVPPALTKRCRFIARGIVWEIQPPADPDGLVSDLGEEVQASAVRN